MFPKWFFLASLPAIRAYVVAPQNDAGGLDSPVQSLYTRNGWNVIEHLGGMGPYIQMSSSTAGPPRSLGDAPPGCEIDQAHMIVRHGERYSSTVKGAAAQVLLLKLRLMIQNVCEPPAALKFILDWQYPEEQGDVEHLVAGNGQYSAQASMGRLGTLLKDKYSRLVQGKTTLWYGLKKDRMRETAQLFGDAFAKTSSAVDINLRASPERGADTLGPMETCSNWKPTRRIGDDKAAAYIHSYGGQMRERFAATFPDLDWSLFSNEEFERLQRLCPLQIMTSGRTDQWCDLFTEDEWKDFEYARDLRHYYRVGPGNPVGSNLGFPWIKATSDLLQAGPAQGKLFFSFVQDNLIIPVVGTMGLFPQPGGLSETSRPPDDEWKFDSSRLFPMGARLVVERLSCDANTAGDPKETYVRIFLNEGAVPIPGCTEEGARGCPLADYGDYVDGLGKAAGNWNDKCGTKELPTQIFFLQNTYTELPA